MSPFSVRASLRTVLVLATLLVPMVVRTNSPLPQYVEFIVDGTLSRTGSGSPKNFAVGLEFRSRWSHSGEYHQVIDGDHPIALTADDGSFAIWARSGEYGDSKVTTDDSLRVVVFVPGEDPLRGAPFTAYSYLHVYDASRSTSGSDGCCEDPERADYLRGTTYIHDDVSITVP